MGRQRYKSHHKEDREIKNNEGEVIQGNGDVHLMLDIETLGRVPGCIVKEIAIISFNPETREVYEEFQQFIDVRSLLKYRADKVDALDYSTICFWMGQEDAARAIFTEEKFKGRYFNEVLQDFIAWYAPYKEMGTPLWCHATFDDPILKTFFERLIGYYPVNYMDVRDIRTLQHFFGDKVEKEEREGTHHRALDDCKYQASMVSSMVRKMREIMPNQELLENKTEE